jgi:pimeloyl-ACP methyl ester carboxylesterase
MAEALQAVASLQPSIHAVVAHSFGCVVTALALRRGMACERVVFLGGPSDMDPYFSTLERALQMGPRGRRAFRERLGRVLQGAGVPGLDITELVSGFSFPALIVHSADDREVPVGASGGWPRPEGSERVQVEGP